MSDIFDLARWERERAHAKHGDTSMESTPADDPTGRRYRILVEEVGEVAREFNDAEHEGRPVNLAKLRTELIQVAAMAGAWADACGSLDPEDGGESSVWVSAQPMSQAVAEAKRRPPSRPFEWWDEDGER